VTPDDDDIIGEVPDLTREEYDHYIADVFTDPDTSRG
jgi:hypothetical protein